MGKFDKLVENANDDEAAELLEKVLERRPLDKHYSDKSANAQITYLGEWLEEAKELVENEGKIWGVTTAIEGFDELTLGMKGGDLIVLAGQTSHGKSLLAINIAYQMAKKGTPVLFTTLEMSKPRTTSRFMSLAKADKIDPAGLPVIFQKASALAYKDIGMLISKAKEEGAQAAIIDHLHFFPRGGTSNMSVEIGRITKHFKEVAVEHDIPVILISHVNRLNDPKAKPSLHNLKESGYIEQDADSVLFVWRDLSKEPGVDPSIMELYIDKSRNDGFPNGRLRTFKQDGWYLKEQRPEPVQIPAEWVGK